MQPASDPSAERRLNERRQTLEAVGSQAAILMGNLEERTRLHQEIELLQESTEALVMARTEPEVIEAAFLLFSVAHPGPLAVWLSVGKLWRELVGVRGMSGETESQLAKDLGELPLVDGSGYGELTERFTRITGVRDVHILECGPATVALGDLAAESQARAGRFGSMVEGTLESLSMVAQAKQRERELTVGLASTAHELKRPVQGTRAAIEQVIGAFDEGTTRRRLLQHSRDELERASEVVESLLNWSAGSEHPLGERIDVREVVEEAVAGFSLEEGRGRIVVDARGPAEVMGDRTSLRIAVGNLIRNALAHGPTDGMVDVRTVSDQASISIEVVDQGPGVPEFLREKIFDPFVRGGSYHPGAGLGLFIARRIVEGYGGHIGVNASSGSTTFSIGLPRALADDGVGVESIGG